MSTLKDMTTMTQTPPTTRIAVNGIQLAVQQAGSGPPVLLIHGFPDDHHVWRKQVCALAAAGYRVIVPDLRGCGDSDVPEGVAPYRLDRLIADLVGLLDALGIEKARVVGHDWGAVLGWQLAIKHPERVERYVALSVGHPNAYARAGVEQKLKGWYTLMFQLRGVAERILMARDWAFFRRFTAQPDETPLWIARLSQPGRLTAAINYYRANLAALLFKRYPPAPVPVLGVWSSGDRFLTEEQMTSSSAEVTGPWQYRRIDGASHWMTLGAAPQLNALLIEYLSSSPEK